MLVAKPYALCDTILAFNAVPTLPQFPVSLHQSPRCVVYARVGGWVGIKKNSGAISHVSCFNIYNLRVGSVPAAGATAASSPFQRRLVAGTL